MNHLYHVVRSVGAEVSDTCAAESLEQALALVQFDSRTQWESGRILAVDACDARLHARRFDGQCGRISMTPAAHSDELLRRRA